MKRKHPFPEHPSVDWMTLTDAANPTVIVTCPRCHVGRIDRANMIAYRIRKGTFTGFCYKDRLFNIRRKDSPERPPHPCVNWSNTTIVQAKKQRLTCVAVTCPVCKTERWIEPGSVIAKIRRGGFTGKCLACSDRAPKRRAILLGPGRKVCTSKGYIVLTRPAITPDDMPLFLAMQGPRYRVYEHRLVMAKAIGRPLTSRELVDHMDGIKTNNDPSNLRLYIRGRNMPGETSGYGTYYHEWQLALARIRELESRS